MSTDLRTQLAAYGDLFAADLDSVTVEDAMSTRLGEGKVRALEPVQRFEDGNKNRRGALLAAAVFVVVVVVAAGLALAWRGSGQDVVDTPAPPFETPEEALVAFDAGIRAGDYEAWKALFAVGVDNFYGSDAVTEQRRQERYQWDSLDISADGPGDIRCTPNGVVERSWTCTVAIPHLEVEKILRAADVLGDQIALGEMDIRLSTDGLIERLSAIRFVDNSGAHGQAMLEFNEWLATGYPELRAAEDVLWGRSDHEADPLLIPIPEMVERYQAIVDEYVVILEGGGTSDMPAPPFGSGEDASIAFFERLAGGDYAAFQALFAPSVPNYFGDASVSEQRLVERFEFEAAGQTIRPDSVECVAKPAVELAWTCTSPIDDESMTRVLVDSELQVDMPPVNEFDIALSSDGFILRVSQLRLAGSGVATGAASEFVMGPWLGANNPDLDQNLIWLWGTGDHDAFPLTISPVEMAEQWQTAFDEYAATLAGG